MSANVTACRYNLHKFIEFHIHSGKDFRTYSMIHQSFSLCILGTQTFSISMSIFNGLNLSLRVVIHPVGTYLSDFFSYSTGVSMPAINRIHVNCILSSFPTVSPSLNEPTINFTCSNSVILNGESHSIPPYFVGPKTTALGIFEPYPAAERLLPIIFFYIFFSCDSVKPKTAQLYLNLLHHKVL